VTVLNRMHHIAYVVKDQEVTRQFYEDVLGLPLIATWAELGEFPPFEKVEFCHTFYSLGDGSAFSFFAFADSEVYEALKNVNGLAHAAMTVTKEDQDSMRSRLEAAGYECRFIDHGYVQSLYVQDPDQLTVEFTSDPPSTPEILAWQAGSAHDTLARWVAGDHAPNNTLRSH
jgi:glyoxylase I family protein